MTSKGSSSPSNLTVVGLQWGDEGKGKIVDYLADNFDAVVRFNGGSNAGHTVVIGNTRQTFHLVPSGALKSKRSLIGAGVALDPVVLSEELAVLKEHGVKANLLVDGKCTLVSPIERKLDDSIEQMRGASALGTTRRGIGPSYALRALRLAPRAEDLFTDFDAGPLVRLYETFGLQAAGYKEWLGLARETLDGIVGDVGAEVDSICDRGGSVLFEGSQGALLDLMHGSYPFVTSSQTVAGYVPASVGIRPSRVGRVMGVTKCYTTRVGGGPFPTEIEGELAARIRETGREYGATTGRPRRVGWLDLVALRYAIRLNGADEIALTKVDVLSAMGEFKACVAYRLGGFETSDFHRARGRLGDAVPIYDDPLDLSDLELSGGAPAKLKRLVDYLEKALGVKVRLVSFGEDRKKTLEL